MFHLIFRNVSVLPMKSIFFVLTLFNISDVKDQFLFNTTIFNSLLWISESDAPRIGYLELGRLVNPEFTLCFRCQ